MLFHTLNTAKSYINIKHTEHWYIYRLHDTPYLLRRNIMADIVRHTLCKTRLTEHVHTEDT